MNESTFTHYGEQLTRAVPEDGERVPQGIVE